MKTVFIRGIFGHCRACGAELNVRNDVVRIHPLEEGGFNYHAHCGDCSGENDLVVDRITHESAVSFLKQVAANRLAMSDIVTPVSPEERILLEGLKSLEATADDEIVALIARGT